MVLHSSSDLFALEQLSIGIKINIRQVRGSSTRLTGCLSRSILVTRSPLESLQTLKSKDCVANCPELSDATRATSCRLLSGKRNSKKVLVKEPIQVDSSLETLH